MTRALEEIKQQHGLSVTDRVAFFAQQPSPR